MKWTELAITHEINRVLGKNTVSYSTVGKYVRMFVLSTKETDTRIVPESEGDLSFDYRIALMLSEKPFLSASRVLKKLTVSGGSVLIIFSQMCVQSGNFLTRTH
jgi:hypothetical protein